MVAVAVVRAKLGAIRAREREARATGHRPRAWKPPRPPTPRDLIGRTEPAEPLRLCEPIHTAFHRLSKR